MFGIKEFLREKESWLISLSELMVKNKDDIIEGIKIENEEIQNQINIIHEKIDKLSKLLTAFMLKEKKLKKTKKTNE